MEHATITPTEWPATTESILASIESCAARDGEATVNEGILCLVRARKALNDARLACLFARRFHAGRIDVRQRLESIAAQLKLEHNRFPLTILDNGGGHERPPIFQQ